VETDIHPTRTQTIEQNRLFWAALLLIAALNGLFALVYTLRSASLFAAHVWHMTSLGGFMGVAAVLTGAYYLAYHDKRRGLALGLAMAAIASQVHIFYTQPAFLSGRGWLYYVVDLIAVVVVSYDLWLQREIRRKNTLAPVVTLDERRRHDSRHAA